MRSRVCGAIQSFMPACYTYRLHRCVPTDPLGIRDRWRQQQLSVGTGEVWGLFTPLWWADYSARSGGYSAPSPRSLRHTAAGFRVPSAAERFEEKYLRMGRRCFGFKGVLTECFSGSMAELPLPRGSRVTDERMNLRRISPKARRCDTWSWRRWGARWLMSPMTVK